VSHSTLFDYLIDICVEEIRIENENRARQLREARVLEETELQAAKIARTERDQALPTTTQSPPVANQALPAGNVGGNGKEIVVCGTAKCGWAEMSSGYKLRSQKVPEI